MGRVIGLADFIATRIAQDMKPFGPPSIHEEAHFTGRDRADLDDWSNRERRVVMHTCDLGVFAMLHQVGVSWASWGVVRQDRRILLWDCVSLADIGRFASMTEALEAVPLQDRPVRPINVLRFAAPLLRAAAN